MGGRKGSFVVGRVCVCAHTCAEREGEIENIYPFVESETEQITFQPGLSGPEWSKEGVDCSRR